MLSLARVVLADIKTLAPNAPKLVAVLRRLGSVVSPANFQHYDALLEHLQDIGAAYGVDSLNSSRNRYDDPTIDLHSILVGDWRDYNGLGPRVDGAILRYNPLI